MRILLALALALALTGCAGDRITETIKAPDGTVTTVNHTDVSYHNKSAAEHAKAESKRISDQALSISTAATDADVSKDAKALLAYLGMVEITRLQPVPFNGKAPTTGMDVAMVMATEGKDWLKSIVTGTIAYKGLDTLKAALERPSYDVRAEEMNVDGSFNQNKATSIGSGTATASQGTTQAAAVEESLSDDAYAIFDECSGGLSYDDSLGTVGSCMAQQGLDVKIEGGLLYLDGTPYGPVNDWEAARP